MKNKKKHESYMDECIRVELRGDTDFTADFLAFCGDNKVFGYRSGQFGGGMLIDYFPLEHKDKILEYLKSKGVFETDIKHVDE